MFGYPVAFVNGLMFAGVFEDTAFARLPPGLRRAVADEEGAAPFEPVPGRPLLAYLTLPGALLEDEALFADLLASACAFTAGLPPKVRRPRKVRNSSSRSYATD